MPASFLRRFKKSQLVDGQVSPGVFDCDDGESGLSFHERNPPLHDGAGVIAYQKAFRLPSGTLLGVCEVSSVWFAGFALPVVVLPEDPAEPFADQHRELIPCPTSS